MRTTIRTLMAATALCTVSANAQNQATLYIQGTVVGCTTWQQVTVSSLPGTWPSFNWTFDLNPFTCGYDTIVEINSPGAAVMVSTTCGGGTLTAFDSTYFNTWNDTVVMVIDLNCGGGAPDCLGIPNGPNLSGTPCDDGDPNTTNDLWNMNCVCTGQLVPGCSADFTIQQLVVNGNPVPWTVTTTNLSTATAPVVYTWWYPDFTSTQSFEVQYTFASAGEYWFSLHLQDAAPCGSSAVQSVFIDTSGMVFTGTPTWDCLGQFMGPAVPGTPCDDNNPMSSNDLWDANCWCIGDTTGATVDCLGITGGTALPGTACDDNNTWTTNDLWNGWCICVGDSIFNTYDCQGVLNGPNVPGSSCDDGDPMTGNDTWDANCVCSGTPIGACQALFAVQQTNPWIISTTNLSNGVAPIAFSWWMPDGSTSTQFEPGHTFTSTGVYGLCLTISDGGGCTSTTCDTVFVDSLGYVFSGFPFTDCLGALYGPNMPGTACDDGDPNTINDTWSVNCACVGYAGTMDCLGITNGPNMPGTACTDSVGVWSYSGIWGNNCTCTPISWLDCNGVQNGPALPNNWCDDGDPNTVGDVWDANCNCAGQGGGWVDCLGIPNGTAMPGTPCDDNNALTYNDTWDGSCNCVGSGGLPCEADFIVTQAYDSLQGPIPGTIWVFFLNNGGQGFTYAWDFGDGTTSNVPFPSHTYSGNGPYLLCLTVSGFGCTDTYCDSVGVDANGIILPMGAQSQGFTINVMGATTAIDEVDVLQEVAIAPNPVNDVLTLSLNSIRSGALQVDVLDVTGKLIHHQRANLATGANTLRLDLGHLEAGPYLLRLNAEGFTRTERFVRGY